LGTIIGHEICHAFDDSGKNYDAYGQKRKWWTKGDIYRYKQKTRDLINLFSEEIVQGKKINGKRTLDENIADLGGVGIALEALKEDQKRRGVSVKEDILAEWREFFISFATSWRTKYRKEKLKRVVEIDVHSPAFLRVNLIVNQFDEWYEAFGIPEQSKLYIEPEDRIRIF
jgi:putative endopeptidase